MKEEIKKEWNENHKKGLELEDDAIKFIKENKIIDKKYFNENFVWNEVITNRPLISAINRNLRKISKGE